jgi:hypothetical protein
MHEQNGEIWGALGHCYLMMDDLQKVRATSAAIYSTYCTIISQDISCSGILWTGKCGV